MINISKDEKYLLEHEDYIVAVCPICESGNVEPKDSTYCICSYCGRKFEYKS